MTPWPQSVLDIASTQTNALASGSPPNPPKNQYKISGRRHKLLTPQKGAVYLLLNVVRCTKLVFSDHGAQCPDLFANTEHCTAGDKQEEIFPSVCTRFKLSGDSGK